MNRLRREPVAIAAVIRTLLAMLVAYGFDFTAEQIATTVLFVEAVSMFLVRQRVTPEPIIGPWEQPLTVDHGDTAE